MMENIFGSYSEEEMQEIPMDVWINEMETNIGAEPRYEVLKHEISKIAYDVISKKISEHLDEKVLTSRLYQKLCDKTETMMMRVYSFFTLLSQAAGSQIKVFENPSHLTAAATGFSIRKVKEVAKKAELIQLTPGGMIPLSPCRLLPLKPKKNCMERGKDLVSKLDPTVIEHIRMTVHDQYCRGQRVTLTDLHAELKNQMEDLDFNYSRTHLYTILLGLDFRFRRVSNRCFIFEKPDLVRKRHKYLKEIKRLRSEEAYIAFCDETWVFQGMKSTHDWVNMDALENPTKYLDAGLKIGPDPAPSRGKRAIVIGAITEDGLLQGSFKVWLDGGRLEDGDYHETMDSALFENWLREVCPKLVTSANGRKAVLIMDNAPYHSQCIEKVPTANSKKQEIIDYLEKCGIQVPKDPIKKELTLLLNAYIASRGGRSNVKKYRAEQIAADLGVEILRLPPYHCILNPIEHTWAYLKQKICYTTSGKEKLEQLRDHSIRIVSEISPETYSKFFYNAVKVEDDFIQKESLSITPIVNIEDLNVDFAELELEYSSDEEYN